MSILLNPYSRPEEWLSELGRLLPDEEFTLWPADPDPAETDLVIAWRMPRDVLAGLPKLQAILSLGAGGDQWLVDGMPDVDVVRLADPAMSDEMAAYAIHWVVRLQRHLDVHEANQRRDAWEQVPYRPAPDYRIGILGYGTIGRRIGQGFGDLGYGVNAWSRSGRVDHGVHGFAGQPQLGPFLGASDAVINVLPNTSETVGLLDRKRLGQMKDRSVLINIGRGTVLDETALIEALDDGPLRAAVLDVTDPEPPDRDSPLWSHPAVHLTPHIAGSTQIGSAAALVAANVRRIRAGEQPFPLLDRDRGY